MSNDDWLFVVNAIGAALWVIAVVYLLRSVALALAFAWEWIRDAS